MIKYCCLFAKHFLDLILFSLADMRLVICLYKWWVKLLRAINGNLGLVLVFVSVWTQPQSVALATTNSFKQLDDLQSLTRIQFYYSVCFLNQGSRTNWQKIPQILQNIYKTLRPVFQNLLGAHQRLNIKTNSSYFLHNFKHKVLHKAYAMPDIIKFISSLYFCK